MGEYERVGGRPYAFSWPSRLRHFLRAKGPSGFSSASTAQEVAAGWDGRGKVAVVTGAYSGVGLEAAVQLAGRGCHVILAGRGKERGEGVVKEHVLSRYPEAKAEAMDLNLASLQSVRSFAKAFLARKLPLHVLVNNAGVMACPYSLSEDGYELQFATNHLGHFLLTRLLLPKVKESCPAGGPTQGRVVNLTSSAHIFPYPEGILPKDRLNAEQGYQKWRAYGQSKLSNILFSKELNGRLEAEGANVIALAPHPGVIPTPLGRHLADEGSMGAKFYKNVLGMLMKDVPQGAATTVYCATAEGLAGGQFYVDSNVFTSSDKSYSRELGERLWAMSEDMIFRTSTRPEA